MRWAIATAVKEIPQHLLPYFDDDEVRATAGAGARPAAAPRITAQDIGALDAMLKMLTGGKYAPSAAAMLLGKAFPQFTPAELSLVLPAEPIVETADPAADAPTTVEPGSIWIDTKDGHRSQVVTVADGDVRFLDLDSDTPDRQWAYRLTTWLERFQPAPAEETPAPPVSE
jgi:hypothetical protein